MNVINTKIKNVSSTLWNHKKKVIVFSGVLLYGADWVRLYNRDARIRRFYALEAEKFGKITISPVEKCHRVTVLINKEANKGKATQLFNKNALPLLNLAGIEVNVIKVANEQEMETITSVLDVSEADCVFVVGGDGALYKLLTGFCTRKSENPLLPVGVFPGGQENGSLISLAPDIFKENRDVRRYCESAMALIENTRKTVAPIKCEIIETESEGPPKIGYLLSNVGAGWFEHCEQKKPKFWYWGVFRTNFVYFWEFLKRKPTPLITEIIYQEFCSGCNKCVQKIEKKPDKRGWFQIFAGVPKEQNAQEVDFSKVENPLCGVEHQQTLKTADLQILAEQDKGCSRLHLLSGGGMDLGRISAIREGWKRAKDPALRSQPKNSFFDTQFDARKITMKFTDIPEFVQKLSISGDWRELENPERKTISLESTRKKIDLFLPNSLRVDLDSI